VTKIIQNLISLTTYVQKITELPLLKPTHSGLSSSTKSRPLSPKTFNFYYIEKKFTKVFNIQ
jgi:hypothetical protein